jgi:hypothetical protein
MTQNNLGNMDARAILGSTKGNEKYGNSLTGQEKSIPVEVGSTSNDEAEVDEATRLQLTSFAIWNARIEGPAGLESRWVSLLVDLFLSFAKHVEDRLDQVERPRLQHRQLSSLSPAPASSKSAFASPCLWASFLLIAIAIYR